MHGKCKRARDKGVKSWNQTRVRRLKNPFPVISVPLNGKLMRRTGRKPPSPGCVDCLKERNNIRGVRVPRDRAYGHSWDLPINKSRGNAKTGWVCLGLTEPFKFRCIIRICATSWSTDVAHIRQWHPPFAGASKTSNVICFFLCVWSYPKWCSLLLVYCYCSLPFFCLYSKQDIPAFLNFCPLTY